MPRTTNPSLGLANRPTMTEVFKDSVQSALKEVLGDSGSRATIYHLGPVDYEDIGDVHARLKTIFGTGALTLERAIVEQLALRMDLPALALRSNDIVKSVSLARAIARHRRKS